MPCDNFLSNLFDRGQREARRAAAEDTTSGDRERAGWRQRHDEWRQRAHRLAEGDTSRGGRENAERQGNSLGRGGGTERWRGRARRHRGQAGRRKRAGRAAEEEMSDGGMGPAGRRRGEAPTAAFWGGFSGQKGTPPPTRSEGASTLLKNLTWCQKSGRRRRRGRGRCSCFR